MDSKKSISSNIMMYLLVLLNTNIFTTKSFQINCGSTSDTLINGILWEADKNYPPNSEVFSSARYTVDPISNTEDDVIFQSERFFIASSGIIYNFNSLINGLYTVNLLFNEMYFQTSNSRVFSINIQNTLVTSNLDILNTVGHDNALILEYNNIHVLDENLSIELIKIIENPQICGIQIIYQENIIPTIPTASLVPTIISLPPSTLPSQQPSSISTNPNTIRINCGSTSNTLINGVLWEADKNYQTDVPSARGFTGDPISNTNDVAIFQSERFFQGSTGLIYEFDNITPGIYTIQLLFTEIFFTQSNMRVFSINIQGIEMITNLDIYDNVGHDVALIKQYEIIVLLDGLITIEFIKNIENPQICGIVISPFGTNVPSISSIPPSLYPSQQPSVPSEPPTNSPVSPSLSSAPTAQTLEPSKFPTTEPESTPHVPALRINCGTFQQDYVYTDSNGNTWTSDVNLHNNALIGGTGDSIDNTNDDTIYQTSRVMFGPNDLIFTLTKIYNTRYDITLHFAETWFEISNARVMDISLQGNIVYSNLDIYDLVGHDKAFTLTFNEIDVNNGILDVKLVKVIENAKLCGMEIIQSQSAIEQFFDVLFINFGGYNDIIIDINGNLWQTDKYITSTNTQTISTTVEITNNISPPETNLVYQHARISGDIGGSIEYSIPGTLFGTSNNGVFDITLYFAEINENILLGDRIMNIEIEGNIIQTGYDIFVDAGGHYIATSLSLSTIAVFDGSLDIKIIATVGNAMISGIFVTQSSDHFGHAVIIVDEVDYLAFEDLTDAGSVETTLDGTLSHTHMPGAELIVWDWDWTGITTDGSTITGSASGEIVNPIIPTGSYFLTLNVIDDFNNDNSITINLEILRGSGYSGCLAYYYSGYTNTLTSIPDFSSSLASTVTFTIEDNINFNFNFNNNGQISLFNNFAAQFMCYIEIDAVNTGLYQFELEANEGAKLYIDGNQLINIDSSHDPLAKLSTNVDLTEGRHEIRIEYYYGESNSIPVLNLWWKLPNAMESVIIPSNVLEYALYQKLSIIESIFPTQGTHGGGTSVVLNGFDFIWDPASDLNIIVEDAFGIVTVDSNDILWDNTDITSIQFIMPASTNINPLIDIKANVYIITPGGKSNGIEYTYLAQGFNAPELTETKYLYGDTDNKDFTVLEFGPDGKLYASNTASRLWRLELEYDEITKTYSVINTLISTVIQQHSRDNYGFVSHVLGMTFNPNDPIMGYDGNGPIVYVSYCQLYHGEAYEDKKGFVAKIWGENLEYIEDVILYLPVNDFIHGINGMAFGANGNFLVNVGSNTNAGIPGSLSGTGLQDEAYFSAAAIGVNLYDNNFNGTLIYDKKGFPVNFNNGVYVYAPGLRNPYDITYHPTFDSYYATDNGANGDSGNGSISCTEQTMSEFGPSCPDKLLKVDFNNYYGSPNRLRGSMSGNEKECIYHYCDEQTNNIPGQEYTERLGVLPSSSDGITVYYTNTWGGQWRDTLICGRFIGEMYRAILNPDDNGNSLLSMQKFPSVGTDGLDVTVDYRGSVFLAEIVNDQISYLVPIDDLNQYISLYITSIWPNMGPITGGFDINIYGYNFGSLGDTTVKFLVKSTIDGSNDPNISPECQVIEMKIINEFDVIICTTPDYSIYGNYGVIDVLIQSGGTEFIYYNGYTNVGKETTSPKIGENRWISKDYLPIQLKYASAVTADYSGYYIFGGQIQSGASNTNVYKYDIITDSWFTLNDAPDYAQGIKQTQQLSAIDGKIYAFGGSNIGFSHYIRRYNHNSDTWEQLAALQVNIDNILIDWNPISAVSALIDNVFYVVGGIIGGINGDVTNRMFSYDIVSNTWSEKSSLSINGIYGASGIGYNGLFYIMGGRNENGSVVNSVYVYNPIDNSWSDEGYISNMIYGVADAGQIVEMDGKLIVIGGIDENEDISDIVERYNPDINEWELLSSMITNRFGLQSVVIDNIIFVVGGDGLIEGYGDVHEALIFM